MIAAMKELFKWHKHHRNNGGKERLGQFFYNTYCKAVKLGESVTAPEDQTLDGIFNADDKQAQKMIEQWLINNHHVDSLPPPIRPVEHYEKHTA